MFQPQVNVILAAWLTMGLAPSGVGARQEGASPVVRHLKHQGRTVAETTNFRIHHHQTREFAEKAAQAAEETRQAFAMKWFGDEDENWKPRCEIYLYATGEKYAEATGVSAEVPGHTTVHREAGRVVSRRIDLHVDIDNLLEAVLPHEITHVVVAGRFPEQRVPPWAAEAMAVLTEPASVIDDHLGRLPRYRLEGLLFPVTQLVRMKDYPDPQRLRPFYTQSVSLVEMLANEKGPETFIQFLRDGLRKGYEPALKRHYGWNFRQLERQWRQHAFKTPSEHPITMRKD